MTTDPEDDWVDRLARLFREHPAWVSSARRLSRDASSTVYFSQRGREAWRLEQRDAETRLVPGAAADPDFVFRFSPESIEQLERVEGNVGELAVTLFAQIVDDEVQLRIVASFARLMRRGYLRLLLLAGPPVMVFGATHGIRTLGALHRFIAELRSSGPSDWEA